MDSTEFCEGMMKGKESYKKTSENKRHYVHERQVLDV